MWHMKTSSSLEKKGETLKPASAMETFQLLNSFDIQFLVKTMKFGRTSIIQPFWGIQLLRLWMFRLTVRLRPFTNLANPYQMPKTERDSRHLRTLSLTERRLCNCYDHGTEYSKWEGSAHAAEAWPAARGRKMNSRVKQAEFIRRGPDQTIRLWTPSLRQVTLRDCLSRTWEFCGDHFCPFSAFPSLPSPDGAAIEYRRVHFSYVGVFQYESYHIVWKLRKDRLWLPWGLGSLLFYRSLECSIDCQCRYIPPCKIPITYRIKNCES